MRLGIDFGRVIQGGAASAGSPDTDFLGLPPLEAIHCPANPGAFDAIAEITRNWVDRDPQGRPAVWIVSKCAALTQAKTLAWIYANRFFERTGIPEDHVRFCQRRGDKAPICAELGIDTFIDDRVGVLMPMKGVVATRILFGPQEHAPPPGLTVCPDWDSVKTILAPF